VSAPDGSPAEVATTERRRRPLLALVAAIALGVVVLDQVTKSLAVSRLADGPVDLLPTLRLHLTFNSGLSFGQGRGLTGYITVLGIALVAALLWWTRRLTSVPMAVGIALLLGGACGNLGDRLFRSHGGAVIDFIDVSWWWVFNVADVAVSCGAVLLIVATLREPVEADVSADGGGRS
jgi:signal peptidase II